MRVRSRLSDESGVAGVIVAVLLVVLVGILALSIDGGLLFSKYRQVRRANDAAAIAAAISCSKGQTTEAMTEADEYAGAIAGPKANIVDLSEPLPTRVSIDFKDLSDNPVADCTTIQDGGKVTVRYRAQQSLMFGPAVGVTSPKSVEAAATAIWGGAGGTGDIIPLAVMLDRLKSPNCNLIPFPGQPTPVPGTQCAFWWDDGALGSSSWGLMALSTWGTDSAPSGCDAGGGTGDLTGAIIKGYGSTLYLDPGAPDVPVYVCTKNGVSINPIDNAVQTALANNRVNFVLPINDSTKQINTCNTQGVCSPYKFAIVAFAFIKPVDLYKRNEAGYSACTDAIPPSGDTANSWCLVASWEGFSYEGVSPGGGPAIGGVVAVGLDQ